MEDLVRATLFPKPSSSFIPLIRSSKCLYLAVLPRSHFTCTTIFSRAISFGIMVGKTWSQDEERFFWHVIIPRSPKSVNPAGRISDWEECAKIMRQEMGEKPRRNYTKLMLCECLSRCAAMPALTHTVEHYFQNVHTGHKSPNAGKFVNAHKRELGQSSGACYLYMCSRLTHIKLGRRGESPLRAPFPPTAKAPLPVPPLSLRSPPPKAPSFSS